MHILQSSCSRQLLVNIFDQSQTTMNEKTQYSHIPLSNPYSERDFVISAPLSSKVFTKAMRVGFHDNRIT